MVFSYGVHKNNPVLGIGPMHYAYYSETYATPHNVILQWGSEYGLPSLFILIGLIIAALFAWVKQCRKIALTIELSEQYLRITLFCTLISALIHSLFGGVNLESMSQILMSIVIGWMMGLYFNAAEVIEVNVDIKKRLQPSF
jgi:putative inorganic carbon (hco3(-)) transporter